MEHEQNPVKPETASLPKVAQALLPFALLILAAFLPYCHTFSYPFHLDDSYAFVDNPVIKNLAVFLDGSGFDYNPRRFIGHLTFALNYHFGGLNVFGYHLVNVGIHILTTLLVYGLTRLTLSTPFFTASTQHSQAPDHELSLSGSRLPRNSWIPLCAGLLFAVHPVQTQAVTYIVQRLASQATLFYLLALVLYVWARLRTVRPQPAVRSPESSATREAVPGAGAPGTLLLLLFSALAALSAMLTKEIAATLPLAVLLYELSFFRHAPRVRRLLLLPFLALALILPLIVMGEAGPLGKLFPSLLRLLQESSHVSRGDYLLTQFPVIVTYLRLLVLPVGQNLDYGYPVYSTLAAAPVFLSAFFMAALSAFAGWMYLKSAPGFPGLACVKAAVSPEPATPGLEAAAPDRSATAIEGVSAGNEATGGAGNEATGTCTESSCADFPVAVSDSPGSCTAPELRLIGFGIFWFFLTLLVESSVIPIADVIFEHRLYLPSFGIFLAVAAAASLLAQRLGKRATFAACSAVILLLALTTFTRNRVWRDPVVLWSDVVSKSPRNERAYCNLGHALLERGQIDLAIANLLTAQKLNPDYAKTYLSLGVAFWQKRMLPEAISTLETAIEKNPQLWLAHYNLSLIHSVKGDVEKAIRHMEAAANLNPADKVLRDRLAFLYGVRQTMKRG